MPRLRSEDDHSTRRVAEAQVDRPCGRPEAVAGVVRVDVDRFRSWRRCAPPRNGLVGGRVVEAEDASLVVFGFLATGLQYN